MKKSTFFSYKFLKVVIIKGMDYSVIKQKIRKCVDGFWSVLFYYDEPCMLCSRQTNNKHILCESCRAKRRMRINKRINREEEMLRVNSCYYYSDIIGKCIRDMKFNGKVYYIESFAEDLCERIIEEELKADFITFVPVSKKRLKKRGYNQSELLAKAVVKILKNKYGMDLESIPTLKKNEGSNQVGLNGIERWKNAEKLFEYEGKAVKKIKNKKAILIDDVLTSGATAYYCSRELLNAGAREVNVITIASV